MNKLNFPAEYSERSDDELLQLASDRSSLTNEAAAVLDDELRRRSLIESDRAKHQQFVNSLGAMSGARKRGDDGEYSAAGGTDDHGLTCSGLCWPWC